MGIRFACGQCGYVLNVKQHQAGKRGICPKCQARVDIPLEGGVESPSSLRNPAPEMQITASTAAATTPTGGSVLAQSPATTHATAAVHEPAPQRPIPSATPASAPRLVAPQLADPIAEAPNLRWYVLPPGAKDPYGPAVGDLFKSWIAEGRVSGDSMVWREDWGTDWKKAGDVLPQLQAIGAPKAASSPAPPKPQPPAPRQPAPQQPVVQQVIPQPGPQPASPQTYSQPAAVAGFPAPGPVYAASPVMAPNTGYAAGYAPNTMPGAMVPGGPPWTGAPAGAMMSPQQPLPLPPRRSRVAANVAIAVLVLIILGLVPLVVLVIMNSPK